MSDLRFRKTGWRGLVWTILYDTHQLKIKSSTTPNSFSDRFYNEIVVVRHRELV